MCSYHSWLRSTAPASGAPGIYCIRLRVCACIGAGPNYERRQQDRPILRFIPFILLPLYVLEKKRNTQNEHVHKLDDDACSEIVFLSNWGGFMVGSLVVYSVHLLYVQFFKMSSNFNLGIMYTTLFFKNMA